MRRLPFDKPGTFLKGNIHTHSTASDGELEPEEVCRRYREAGYSFLAITDHFLQEFDYPIVDTRPFRTAGFTTIIGAELHAPIAGSPFKWDVVALDLPLDFEPWREGETGPEIAARALAAGAFAIAVHPHHSFLSPEAILSLGPVQAIEIYNGVADCVDKGDGWYVADLLFQQGKHYLVTAADDAHFESFRTDFGLGWIWVRSEELSPTAIMQAVRAGHYYASTGPTIEAVNIIPPDTVEVVCSPASRVMMLGADGESKSAEGDGITECRLTRNWPSPWMRVIVRDEYGRRAWTNTFWY